MKKTGLCGWRAILTVACGMALSTAWGAEGQTADPETFTPPRFVLKAAKNDGRLLRIPPPARVRAGAPRGATVTIHYLNAGESNAFGDVCIGWPEHAKAAFTYAANIWGAMLNSKVPITINACWANMTPADVLGHGGASEFRYNFAGAPFPNTLYPISLANACAGVDMRPNDQEVIIAYNAQQPWYLGTDGNCPRGQYDFATVILHEICHGLGFLGSWNYQGGYGAWGSGGLPIVYDRFIINLQYQYLINTAIFPNPSVLLGGQLTGNGLFFAGQCAAMANGGTPPAIYAPTEWSGGSSACHLGEVFRGTTNALMVYSFPDGYSIHNPGPITMGLLKDIGWTAGTPPRPVVMINGSTNNMVLSRTDAVTVQISLNPGDNTYAERDWWAIADTASGMFNYVAGAGWLPIANLGAARPAYQGQLTTLQPYTILQMPSLAAGTYRIYFGVDARNGVVDPTVIYSAVTATVQ